MILTEQQRKEFEEVVKPVMKFLSDPQIFHPYFKVIVELGRAEILEGSASFVTEEYVVD